MDIKILGGGCSKCERLESLAREAAAELDLEANFIKIKSLQEIMAYDVMVTPALVIGDSVKSSGRLPTVDEIKGWLSEAL
jgi:small redox-active disulfide protein 2